jgi:hypothetical protein
MSPITGGAALPTGALREIYVEAAPPTRRRLLRPLAHPLATELGYGRGADVVVQILRIWAHTSSCFARVRPHDKRIVSALNRVSLGAPS